MTAILNKKVLLAASVALAVAAVALGATYAAWQAQDTITGNTVGTANLSIDAIGAAAFGSVTKPITANNVLPGWKSNPAERAEVTNNSSVALDLWFYVDQVASSTPGACDATVLAWRASTPGDGSNYTGYGPSASDSSYETTATVGTIASYDGVDPQTGLYAHVDDLTGVSNAVKIATAGNGFAPTQKIAIRQVAGFATDADYVANSGSCEWTEVFVGTLPGQYPAGYSI